MAVDKFVLLTVFLIVGVLWCSEGVLAAEIPDDLDPREQIAQHNNEYGQLRAVGFGGRYLKRTMFSILKHISL